MSWLSKLGKKDPSLKTDIKGVGALGQGAYDYGKGITEEGLAGLRSLDTTYQGRLADPLGDAGRKIFTLARGGLQDEAIRRQRASGARIFQMATQTGGTLSPEAQAELQVQNQRGVDEQLFKGQNELTQQEGALTLQETSKLFDRMEGIKKTILGVGQDEKVRGLQAILAALGLRQNDVFSKRQVLSSFANTLGGAAAGGAAGGAGGGAPAGGDNVWGVK